MWGALPTAPPTCMLVLAVAAGESGANPELSRNGMTRTDTYGPSPTTCRWRSRFDRSGCQTSGPRGWAGGRRAEGCPDARRRLPRRPRAERGSAPHVTIAPADPASAITDELADAPGTALLRTLTEFTADLPDTDPGRVAAAALRGRNARSDAAELRELATEAAAGLISEDPAYSRLAARLLTVTIAEEAASQGAVSFSASVETGHREGLIADRTARVRPRPRRPPGLPGGRRARRRRRRPLRLLRPAHPLLPLPAAPPDHPQGRRDPPALHAARGVRPRRGRVGARPGRSGVPVRPDEPPGLPAVLPHALQLRHPPPPDVVLLPARLAAGRAGLHLRPLPPGGAALEARGRHRPLLLPRPRPRFADPGHQRPLQRHRPLPQDPGRLGRRGQPGRPAQGRGRGVPGDLALRHRGVPGAARQHRRGPAPYAQPEPRALDPRRVHAPRRRRRRRGRCSRRPTCPSSSTCGARSSTPPTARPRPPGSPARPCRRAICTAA